MNGYITLDYELSMGRSTGTPEKCLIEPMNHLTAMVDDYGVKMNVFVDAAYLLRMRELKEQFPQLKNDYETVINHIAKLDAEGHAIQLHLHPQWVYSIFDGSRWILDFNHYKLSDMPLGEQKNLITEGTQLLNSIIKRKVSAFRAGGYSIENFADLYETFLSVGIVNETSVLRGAYQKGKYQTYDYRSVPLKTSYRIVGNLTKEELDGTMTEYPIATKFSPYLLHFFRKHIYDGEKIDEALSKIKWGDGVGIGFSGNRFQKLTKQMMKFFSVIPMRACIDECYSFESVYRHSVRHFSDDDFVIMGHPKLISPYSIAILEQFIKCHPEIEFKLFSPK